MRVAIVRLGLVQRDDLHFVFMLGPGRNVSYVAATALAPVLAQPAGLERGRPDPVPSTLPFSLSQRAWNVEDLTPSLKPAGLELGFRTR